MNTCAYYSTLPDSMTVDEVEAEFQGLLNFLEGQRFDSVWFIKPLMELAERQWHTYSVLSPCLKARIEDHLISAWDGDDLELVENFIGIMVRLGLERCSMFLRSLKETDVSPKAFNEVSLAISEFGDSVSDPYSGVN
ncbi:hypothetical protein [Pseudomonas graminis]|uniref:hypothetical protein n=1 Tax=Pseudomonas graminis TaxID=158627 RepID=UPI001060BE67|nr:hypothetical protein [Pseudomonas graminis]